MDKVNILLVDDDEGSLKAAESVLEGLGQNVFKGTSARDALRLVLTHDFAAILLDVKMPEMDGFECARLIRERERSSRTPIIFLTGIDEGRLPRFQAYEVGAVDYLVKPIEPSILRSKVAVFVDLAQKTAEVRRVGEMLRQNEAREHARKLLEREKEAALSQQRWLEAILDALPTPLVLLDPMATGCRFANHAARALAGGVFAFASQKDWVLTTGEGEPLREDQLPTLRAARGERLEGEVISFRGPGGEGAVAAFSERLPAQHGNTETVLVSLHDVSVLKRAERTLQEAVVAREDFIAVGSHELRTPITALKFQVRNAIKSWDKPELITDPAAHALKYLGQVRASVERLGRLAEYLLDVSRLTSSQLQLEPTEFALEQLVREVALRPSEGTATPYPLTITTDGDTHGSWDRARLEQLITNLLDNARRYAPGPVELLVRGQGEQVSLFVKDHGPGIAPEALPRIFERFNRARPSDDFRGFGLGLWIVAQLASHHGGTVEAKSTLGEGSIFTVHLPRRIPSPAGSPNA